jgi:hypothetical protein
MDEPEPGHTVRFGCEPGSQGSRTGPRPVYVEVLLTSSWSFSAIYPLPQGAITPGQKQQLSAQSLTWTVDAEPDGRLVDKTSGVEVTYLYWEATYVMLFLCYPTAINLHFFPQILYIWLSQPEFPSRRSKRFACNLKLKLMCDHKTVGSFLRWRSSTHSCLNHMALFGHGMGRRGSLPYHCLLQKHVQLP